MDELQILTEIERRGELTAEESARLNELRGGPGPQQAPTGPPAAPPPQPPVSGNILPLTRDETGLHFDSDAGIAGMAKDAYRIGRDFMTLPGDVRTGKVNPMTRAGQEETIKRSAEGAAEFGLMGLGGPVPRSVAAGTGRAIAGAPLPAAPTVEALKAAAKVSRDSVANMGVDYNAHAVAKMAKEIMEDLASRGNTAEKAKTTFSILRKMAEVPKGPRGSRPLVQAQTLAEYARSLKDISDPADAAVGGKAAKAIRQWIDEAGDPAHAARVVAGDASRVSRALAKHDADYAAAMRGKTVRAIGEKATAEARKQGSGTAYDRTVRGKILSKILDPERPERAFGYSEAEKLALSRAMKGTVPNRMSRAVGRLAGGGRGGVGLPSAVGGGAGLYQHDPLLFILGAGLPMATGAGARANTRRLTRRALGQADEMIRMRSPEGQRMLAEQAARAVPEPFKDPRKMDALIRALLVGRQYNPLQVTVNPAPQRRRSGE